MQRQGERERETHEQLNIYITYKAVSEGTGHFRTARNSAVGNEHGQAQRKKPLVIPTVSL